MSVEKKSEVTEEVKEARKLTEEDLEQVTGGARATQSRDGLRCQDEQHKQGWSGRPAY